MPTPVIKFKVTEERTELLPLGVYRRLDKDGDAQVYFLAHYLVDPADVYLLVYDEETGVYLAGLDQAYELLDPMPVRQIRVLVAKLQGQAEDIAVPKA